MIRKPNLVSQAGQPCDVSRLQLLTATSAIHLDPREPRLVFHVQSAGFLLPTFPFGTTWCLLFLFPPFN